MSEFFEKVARAWAAIDGKSESFDACKADSQLDDTRGHYSGYMHEAEELLDRSGVGAMLEREASTHEALLDTTASLAAAISLLEGGGKAAKKAAASDRMFDQMLVDYRGSLARARVALAAYETAPYRHGSAAAELDRTAEMVVDLAGQGKIDQAIWLIFDGNRFDAVSMHFLAQRVQDRAIKKGTAT